jgi:hypothetical protein
MMLPLMLASTTLGAPPAADDIVVLGERIRKFRFSVRQDEKTGTLTCKIKRKSGDPSLDASLCNEAKICVGQNDSGKPNLAVFEACLKARFGAVRLARTAQTGGA